MGHSPNDDNGGLGDHSRTILPSVSCSDHVLTHDICRGAVTMCPRVHLQTQTSGRLSYDEMPQSANRTSHDLKLLLVPFPASLRPSAQRGLRQHFICSGVCLLSQTSTGLSPLCRSLPSTIISHSHGRKDGRCGQVPGAPRDSYSLRATVDWYSGRLDR